jgi:TP901 family phage tail tape measure protein
MRQFGISTNQLEGALGSINSVAAKFAVEASDIIAAIQRTGGVFAAASRGVSEGTDALNEFVAVFTSIRATTRESAETIATGLRTIFTRIQRGPTIEALKQFGVNLTDVEGKFVGAYKGSSIIK